MTRRKTSKLREILGKDGVWLDLRREDDENELSAVGEGSLHFGKPKGENFIDLNPHNVDVPGKDVGYYFLITECPPVRIFKGEVSEVKTEDIDPRLSAIIILNLREETKRGPEYGVVPSYVGWVY